MKTKADTTTPLAMAAGSCLLGVSAVSPTAPFLMTGEYDTFTASRL